MNQESKLRLENARKVFQKEMVMTLVEVADLIQASTYTARVRLKEWQAITSYNKNGRYYTLPDVPEFDANGLWHRRGVYFSRYGTLKQTVVELVRHSQAGLNSGDFRSLLGLDPRSFLSAFSKNPNLEREKVSGQFVYYSSAPALCDKQRQCRLALNANERQPTTSEAVEILVEKIKCPSLSNEALSQRLRKKKIFVSPEIIQNLFVHNDLELKKTENSV